MRLQNRHAEVLTSDANLRFTIYDRADHRYQIVEERVRTYESGKAWPPHYVPFPCDAHWQLEVTARWSNDRVGAGQVHVILGI